ncbi:MAG: hypothetical protein OEZ06_09885 [Myxococcales bacterium]|nr:hypothetical protein [Myxococcales bacterium]
MSSDGEMPGPAKQASAAERIGRRVGLVIFWLVTAYLVAMSCLSVIPALYFPSLAPRPKPLPTATCANEIEALEGELVEAARRHLEQRSVRGMKRWLDGWDARYMRMDGGCGPLDASRQDLQRVRDEFEDMLERYGQTPSPIQQRIRHRLDELRPAGNGSEQQS